MAGKSHYVQLITGPDSWGQDDMVERALSEAGFEVVRIDVDDQLASGDVETIASQLSAEAGASVVVSGLRWNRLVDVIDPDLLPNGITLTSNRASSLAEKHTPVLPLSRPISNEDMRPVVRAVELLTVPIGGSWQKFEKNARDFMGLYTGVEFHPGRVGQVPKLFDMVWDGGKIVGDAKYLALVKGEKLPPAKFMEIAGHVWLLNATNARRRLLVFGNDIRVPEWWLKKYGALVQGVEFYFLADYGQLKRLN